jgi:hypothetical protein
MNSRKLVRRAIANFTLVTCVACSGGGSSTEGANSEGGDSSKPNRGLQGTVYFASANYSFGSMDLTNPTIKIINTDYRRLVASSTSFDGKEHLVVRSTSDPDFERLDIIDSQNIVRSGFEVEYALTGSAKLSPDNQFIAVGVDPMGYGMSSLGRG